MTFSEASAVSKDGAGIYRADLHPDWSVGRRLHGGYLLAVATRAAAASSDRSCPDPVAVSAQYFRPPEPGTAQIRTETIKQGRTVSVIRAVLEQDGVACLEATVTTGRLVDEPALWAEEHGHPPRPPDDAVDTAALSGGKVFGIARHADVLLDPAGAAFLATARGEPRLRVWARPRDEEPDSLFALMAGDIAMPTTFNLGYFGWTPTVQLTGLVRGHPAPGWLTVAVATRSVQGGWFDEDATITDSTGRVVCQVRQLALLPR